MILYLSVPIVFALPNLNQNINLRKAEPFPVLYNAVSLYFIIMPNTQEQWNKEENVKYHVKAASFKDFPKDFSYDHFFPLFNSPDS